MCAAEDCKSFLEAVAEQLNGLGTYDYREYCGELQVRGKHPLREEWHTSSSNEGFQKLYWELRDDPGKAPLFAAGYELSLSCHAGRAWLAGGGTL